MFATTLPFGLGFRAPGRLTGGGGGRGRSASGPNSGDRLGQVGVPASLHVHENHVPVGGRRAEGVEAVGVHQEVERLRGRDGFGQLGDGLLETLGDFLTHGPHALALEFLRLLFGGGDADQLDALGFGDILRRFLFALRSDDAVEGVTHLVARLRFVDQDVLDDEAVLGELHGERALDVFLDRGAVRVELDHVHARRRLTGAVEDVALDLLLGALELVVSPNRTFRTVVRTVLHLDRKRHEGVVLGLHRHVGIDFLNVQVDDADDVVDGPRQFQADARSTGPLLRFPETFDDLGPLAARDDDGRRDEPDADQDGQKFEGQDEDERELKDVGFVVHSSPLGG